MAPILKKGLFCCLSLRTCALILGTITLAFNLLTLSMFIVSLDMWLSESDYHHWNHTEGHLDGHLDVHQQDVLLHHELQAAVNASTHPAWAHPSWGHAGNAEEEEPEDYDGFEDSEAMEELLERNPHRKEEDAPRPGFEPDPLAERTAGLGGAGCEPNAPPRTGAP